MHGHIYTNGYKTSEEYKALYCYYMSLYSDPFTEKYKASLSELEHKISQSDANKSSAPKSVDLNTAKADKNEQQTKKEPKLKEIKKAKIEKVKQKKDSKKIKIILIISIIKRYSDHGIIQVLCFQSIFFISFYSLILHFIII